MKKLLAILLLVPAMVFGQELATYSITTAISGMNVPGLLPGAGDRSLSFELAIPADDMEAANELFYEHLKLILGPGDIEAYQALAEQMSRGARR